MARRTLRIVALTLVCLLTTLPARAAETPAGMQLNVKNASVQEVLRMIAEAGGFNIAIGGGVKGSITLAVNDMPPRDLLDVVVGVVDAAYVQENGAVWVMTGEDYEHRFGAPFADRMVSRTVALQRAQLKEILPSVKALLGDQAVIKPDLAGNTLTVKGHPRLVREAVQMLEALDVPALTRSYQLHGMRADMAAGLLGKMVTEGTSIIEDPIHQRLVINASESELDRLGEIIGMLDVGGGVESRVLSVHHALPDTLANTLRPHLTPEVGMIHADPRARKLVVVDYPHVIESLSALVAAMDVPLRQVLLEARIIQVSTSREIRSGIDWSAVQEKVNLSGTFPALTGTDPGLRGDFGDLSSTDVQVIVQALEVYGDTELLSNPRLMVVDGGTGLIHVGSQVPYTTIDTRETAAGTINQFEKVVVIDVGIKLEVSVNILGGDMISMSIRPEVSSVSGYSQDDIPIVEAATTDSALLIQDGNTVILGGLIKDETRKVRKGVPLLCRIPLLKYLFSSNVEESLKSELVILLTPRIMTGRESYAEGS